MSPPSGVPRDGGTETIAALAYRLHSDMGYLPAPIAPGVKWPKGVPRWQDPPSLIQTRHRMAAGLYREDGGIGLLTGVGDAPLAAVDIDILDAAAATIFTGIIFRMAGPAPVRVGRAPKALLLYRASAPGIAKMQSSRWRDAGGAVHQVEVMGTGQQFVAYGRHPSGSLYTWSEGEPSTTDAASLPAVAHETLQAIMVGFDTFALERGWERVSRGASDQDPGKPTDALGNVQSRGTHTLREYADILERLDPSMGRPDWIRVGMAGHHAFAGSDEAFTVWENWSEGGDNFVPGHCEVAWRSFVDARHAGNPVTFGTLRHMVRSGPLQADHQDPRGHMASADLEFWMQQNLVHIAQTDEVARLDIMRDRARDWRATGPLPSFALDSAKFRSASRHLWLDPSPLDTRKVPKRRPAAEVWERSPFRKSVPGAVWAPGEKEFVKRGGEVLLNTYIPPAPAPVEVEADTGPFWRHMETLVPGNAERAWLIQFCAHILQRPQTRVGIVPLLVSRMHGTGKTSVAIFLSRLVGNRHYGKTDIGSVLRPASNFNGHIFHQKLVTLIDEVHVGRKRGEVDDVLRDLITTEETTVEQKYVQAIVTPVYTNFIFCSNHLDALRLAPHDRRVQCIRCTEERQGSDYADELDAMLNDPVRIAVLRRELLAHPLAGFDRHKPLDTELRRTMTDSGHSLVAEAFADVLEHALQSQLVVTPHLLIDAVSARVRRPAKDISYEVLTLWGSNKDGWVQGRKIKQKRDGKTMTIRPWLNKVLLPEGDFPNTRVLQELEKAPFLMGVGEGFESETC